MDKYGRFLDGRQKRFKIQCLNIEIILTTAIF